MKTRILACAGLALFASACTNRTLGLPEAEPTPEVTSDPGPVSTPEVFAKLPHTPEAPSPSPTETTRSTEAPALPSVNGPTKNDPTSPTDLIRAAAQGDLATVQTLIRKGADINATIGSEDKKITALLAAIVNVHPEVARFLILNGAKSDQLYAGYSPFHFSVFLKQNSVAGEIRQKKGN